MKTPFPLIFLLFLTLSCQQKAEEFVEMDPSRFNVSLKARTDISTPEQVMEMFYDYSPKQGAKGIKITSKDLGSDSYRITLIHDPVQAGNQIAWKLIMHADRSKGHWRATQIQKNWKCEKGKGHRGWGIGKCE